MAERVPVVGLFAVFGLLLAAATADGQQGSVMELPSLVLPAAAMPFLPFAWRKGPRQFSAAKAFEQVRCGNIPTGGPACYLGRVQVTKRPTADPGKHHISAAVGGKNADDGSTVQPGVLNKGGGPAIFVRDHHPLRLSEVG